MYKIIGADGKEYGPITAEQVRQWVAEGRANAQTKVLPDGSTDWKTLAEVPELATAATMAPPLSQPAYAYQPAAAVSQVQGPAIGLIVTAILGFIAQVAGLLMNILGVSMGAMQSGRQEAWMNMFSGGLGIASSIFAMAIAGLILYGALKMKKLESYGWAMTASIIAMVPCFSPCCLIGLPIGIWALVVLSKPEVKGAFH